MAAKAKLTPEQWQECKNRWENDPRTGSQWLVVEMQLPVTKDAISHRIEREGWAKKVATKVSKKVAMAIASIAQPVVEPMVSPITRPVGRPSLYRMEYAEQAYQLCLLGATDVELGIFFGVCTTTIDTWKHEHPEFLVALKKGKTFADANVAESLYKRAIGCSHTESHVSNFKGDITVTNITKNYPPDTGAAFIWLKNRQPQKWKEKIELKEDINLNVFPPKEVLDKLFAESLQRSNERAKMLIGRRERITGEATD